MVVFVVVLFYGGFMVVFVVFYGDLYNQEKNMGFDKNTLEFNQAKCWYN